MIYETNRNTSNRRGQDGVEGFLFEGAAQGKGNQPGARSLILFGS